MLTLIVAALIQSAISEIDNGLDGECKGLVLNAENEWEYGYPAGACWSWGEGESVILKCNENDEITVVQYQTDNCVDDGWETSYEICTSDSELPEDVACQSYCSESAGCDYFTIKYWDTECDINDGSPTTAQGDAENYWTRMLLFDYCYMANTTDFSEDSFYKDATTTYFKFQSADNAITQSFYSDPGCLQQIDDSAFGTVGESTCDDERSFFTGRYVSSRSTASTSSDDVSITTPEITGRGCIITGDPHFTTFDAQNHHTQGEANEQYYYVAPCSDKSVVDLPFTISGLHGEWTSGSRLTGVEQLEIELYESPSQSNGVITSIFVTSDGSTGVSNLPSNSRFTFEEDDGLYSITVDDGDCGIKFKFEGRTVTILPPTCETYREATCGLCGDFKYKSEPAKGKLLTCEGQLADFKATDSEFWENTISYDTGGLGWAKSICDVTGRRRRRRLQLGSDIVYTPTLPDNLIITNPCNSSIEALTTISCQTARDNAAECCDILGSDVCDSLQEDCAYDACVSAGNNATDVDKYVTELFTDAVSM
eukprot:CAMPEP_0201591830 /NCGR_PEP_ID=MMETSP0190_2-20130828/189888_1 /ASSEMBLY_ACC=CAM_ASM_000263 /TAXON_ID=37353 /ORGANISM="Rosalina sp." /LENGTH=539 /DNA_ID=CAMNT_0048050315 /DNA_START=179 /DNA_END=1798 /DNA_ORIENTATION=-